MILSILIPTIVGRENKFESLISSLQNQVVDNGVVEICYLKDNKEISIGSKRQKLIENCCGDYVVFIDDDDTVSSNYVGNILDATSLNPDAVGFKIQCMIDGKGPFVASASNKWDDWAENKGGFKYVRTPYQKTPIKRDIALQIGYNDMRYGEDYDYSKRLKQSGLIQSEVFIDEVMYFYNFRYEDPKTKYGI
jgi:glycosyltransferase involved in cell wall biosynthesis